MFDRIYLEKRARNYPLSEKIISRVKKTRPEMKLIEIESYSEVFNPKGQNFRLQKQNPALILAEKENQFVMPAPEGYGIGGKKNFYFSHMLNCIYDCRYCFLQGMYSSANFLLFVNYENFKQEIIDVAKKHNQETYFFSGYDCDSLALDDYSLFIENFVPLFDELPNSKLELRTKSCHVKNILDLDLRKNIICAFSLNPENIISKIEHKTPSLKRRLDAIKKLSDKGWMIGLRFDPLIFHDSYKKNYSEMFKEVFSAIKPETLHSVSLGPMRFPKKMFSKISNLYPEEKLLSHSLEYRSETKMVSYSAKIENEMNDFCSEQLLKYINEEKFFRCMPEAKN